MELTNITCLINQLKCKIKKLELLKVNNESNFMTKKINIPSNLDKNKKYIGLQFNDDFEKNTIDNNKSFIKIIKQNHIINYHINIKLDKCYEKSKEYFSFTLGIKENNKIKPIKSSRTFCRLDSAIDKQLTISNTTIYLSNKNQELCLIAEFPSNCGKISFEKGILNVLSLN